VGGIAGEEQAPEAQRLGDKAAQRRDALLERRPGHQRRGRLRIEPAAQLVPEFSIGPLLDLVAQRALQVVAAARMRAHAAQGETALVLDVDQLVRDRRRVREQAQPA